MKRVQDLKIGEIFKYGCFEWIKLDVIKDETLAIMKDKLQDNEIFDTNSNNWRKSELRKWLNEHLLHELIAKGATEENFLMFERDLTADDAMKEYGSCKDRISIITCEEYRRYRNLIPVINDWWWTLTAYSCREEYRYGVRVVDSSGYLAWNVMCNNGNGVRPLCYLKSKTWLNTSTDEVNKRCN